MNNNNKQAKIQATGQALAAGLSFLLSDQKARQEQFAIDKNKRAFALKQKAKAEAAAWKVAARELEAQMSSIFGISK